jgi:F420-0:gamma-glutamyl ligase
MSRYELIRDEYVMREGRNYRRMLVRTPWFENPFDLAELIKESLGDHLRPGSTAFVCEKLAVVAEGRTVATSNVRVGRFARFASRHAQPTAGNLAQSIPERMQFVINQIGWTRTLLACAAAAVTRPFKLRGAFFVVAGREARDLDGMHPPYDGTLLPPFTPREASRLVNRLAAEVGTPVAIVDINDKGGRVRAVSPGGLPMEDLYRALSDNPMGHNDQSTPIGVVHELLAL